MVLQSQATAISGVSVSESGDTTTSGESFTAVLADSDGVMAATTGATGGHRPVDRGRHDHG